MGWALLSASHCQALHLLVSASLFHRSWLCFCLGGGLTFSYCTLHYTFSYLTWRVRTGGQGHAHHWAMSFQLSHTRETESISTNIQI